LVGFVVAVSFVAHTAIIGFFRSRQPPYSDRLLDPFNPRLKGDLAFGSKDPKKVLRTVWQYGVDDIVESISHTGYQKLEPFFAEKDTLIVIEGNRRLAALKLLLNPKLADDIGAEVPPLRPDIRKQCEKVPVVFGRRSDVWAFVGMKHLNGPRQWDALGKAFYVKRVKEEDGRTLEEIAAAIGSDLELVRGWYRALRVLDQAKEWGVYDEKNHFKKSLYISHLYQGLEYPGFQEFLGMKGWSTPDETPVPVSRKKELGELLVWLWGDRKRDVRPLVWSQNPDLKNLDRALQTQAGRAELRRDAPLSMAVEASEGDEVVVLRSLQLALEQMEKAQSKFPIAYKGQTEVSDLLKKLDNVLKGIIHQKEFGDYSRGKRTH
jgi:hypothetical protein